MSCLKKEWVNCWRQVEVERRADISMRKRFMDLTYCSRKELTTKETHGLLKDS